MNYYFDNLLILTISILYSIFYILNSILKKLKLNNTILIYKTHEEH